MKVQPLTLDNAPLSVRQYFSSSTGPLVGTLAQVPELLQVAMPFIAQSFGASALSMRHKEMIILLVSVLQGCRYCTQTHTVVAFNEGLSTTELASIRTGQPQGFAPKEQALVDFVIVMGAGILDKQKVDQVMTLLTEHWLDFEVVEISMLIGTVIMLNRYCIALDLPTSETHLQWLENEGWL